MNDVIASLLLPLSHLTLTHHPSKWKLPSHLFGRSTVSLTAIAYSGIYTSACRIYTSFALKHFSNTDMRFVGWVVGRKEAQLPASFYSWCFPVYLFIVAISDLKYHLCNAFPITTNLDAWAKLSSTTIQLNIIGVLVSLLTGRKAGI